MSLVITREAEERAEATRASDEYKSMDSYHACEVAEGFGSGEDATPEETRAAWQYILDTGLYKTLQGWYGRTVTTLMAAGEIAPPSD